MGLFRNNDKYVLNHFSAAELASIATALNVSGSVLTIPELRSQVGSATRKLDKRSKSFNELEYTVALASLMAVVKAIDENDVSSLNTVDGVKMVLAQAVFKSAADKLKAMR